MDISIFDSIEEKIIIETGENYYKRGYIKDFDIQQIDDDVLLLRGNLLIEDKSYSSESIVNLSKNVFDTSFCTCDESGDFCSHRVALIFKYLHDQSNFIVDGSLDKTKFTEYKRNLAKGRFFKSIKKISEKYSIKIIMIAEDFFNNEPRFRLDFYHEERKINFYTDISYNEKWDEQRNFNYTLFPMKDRLIVKTINDWFEHIPEDEFVIPKNRFDLFMKLISDFPEIYLEPGTSRFTISKSYFKPKLILSYTDRQGSVKADFDSSIKIINGEFNQWVYIDTVLHPMRLKLSEDVWHFLIQDQLYLPRNEIANFYYEIIPKIEHSFDIESTGNIGLENVKKNSYIFVCDYDNNILITPRIKGYVDVDGVEQEIQFDNFEFNSVENIYLTYHMYDHYYVCKRNILQEKKILFMLKKYNIDLSENIFVQKDKLFYKSFLEEGINKLKLEGEVEFTENFRKIMIEKTYIFIELLVDQDEEDLELLSINEFYFLSNGMKLATEAIDKIYNGKRFLEMDNALTLIENYNEIKRLKTLLYSVAYKTKNFADHFLTKFYNTQFLYVYDEIIKINKESPQTQITLKLPPKLERMISMRESFLVNQDLSIFKKKVAIPEQVKNTLRNYQKFGFFWFHFLKEFNFGGILADDMGLGKTVQIITFIKSLNSPKPSLIICPTSLLHNWQNEIYKFFPGTKYLVVKGNITERKSLISHINRYEIVITSYSLIRNDIDEFKIFDFETIVLDEANHIKNPNTHISNVVKLLSGNHRFVLTGTPVENNLHELWSIFSFVSPQLLGKYKTFKEYYIDNFDEKRLDELKQIISPFLLRRTKDDVLKELPPKIIQTYTAELSPLQKTLYQDILLDVRETIMNKIRNEGLQKSKIHILTALLKLRQIANHPALINPMHGIGPDISGKCDLLKEILIESIDAGHKILIFSQFTNMLGILEKEIQNLAFSYAYLDGSTPEAKREKEINKFKTTDTPIFLISLKAGGYGLNIPEADTVVIVDPWWNPMVEMQAIDRAHRMGQSKTVTVYKLITKDTIEEKIIKLQEKKKKLFDAVVNVNNIFKNLTEEDVEEFFS